MAGGVVIAITEYLTNNVTVGGVVGNRIHAITLPSEESQPDYYILVKDISEFEYENLSGGNGLFRARIQITSCNARDFGLADDLRRKVDVAMRVFSGVHGDVIIKGVNDAKAKGSYLEAEVHHYHCFKDYFVLYSYSS